MGIAKYVCTKRFRFGTESHARDLHSRLLDKDEDLLFAIEQFYVLLDAFMQSKSLEYKSYGTLQSKNGFQQGLNRNY